MVALIFASVVIAGCTGTPESQAIQPIMQEPQSVLESPESTPEPTKTAPSESTNEQIIIAESVKKASDVINIQKAEVMGDYIIEGIKKFSEIHSDLRDDFAVKDYDKMAANSLKLQRYSELIIDDIAIDERLPNKDVLGSLSSRDILLFNKYLGYVKGMKSLAQDIQFPLSWIKDDPSKVSLLDKADSFSYAISQSKGLKKQLKELMNLCDDMGVKCGKDSSERKLLDKEITFF